MMSLGEKLPIMVKVLKDRRFRLDIKALKYAAEGYTSYAWELCEEIGIASMLKGGSDLEGIVKEKCIMNIRFLECILDFLVGMKVLKYEKGVYTLAKQPKPFTGKKYEFLKKFYPNSVEWTDSLRKKSKDTLLTGKRHFDAGFDHERFIQVWDGLMKESPWSIRKLAIEKFSDKINNGAEILDLGCGSGTSLEQILLECRKEIILTGMDASGPSLEKAKENLKKLYKATDNPAIKKNLESLILIKHDLSKDIPKDKSYDVVFMSLLVHHIPEEGREAFFRNVNDILKDGGMAVIYQIIHKSKFERAPMWVMYTVPTHEEYPFKDEYINMLSGIFSRVKPYLDGTIIVAHK